VGVGIAVAQGGLLSRKRQWKGDESSLGKGTKQHIGPRGQKVVGWAWDGGVECIEVGGDDANDLRCIKVGGDDAYWFRVD